MPNVERLEQLYRVVEEVPEKLLNMGTFSDVTTCGTVRCAAGHAAVDPWFVENTPIGEIFRSYFGLVRPADSTPTTCSRLADLFEVGEDDAHLLFYTADKATPREHVLDNIQRLIDGKPLVAYDFGA